MFDQVCYTIKKLLNLRCLVANSLKLTSFFPKFHYVNMTKVAKWCDLAAEIHEIES